MGHYRTYEKKPEKNYTLHEGANWSKKGVLSGLRSEQQNNLFSKGTISQNTGLLFLTPIKFMAVISYEMFINKHVW